MAELASGLNHVCARLRSGGVTCWGTRENGRLGDGGSVSGVAPPVVVQGLSDAARLEAGAQHTCAIRSGGEVVCWGGGLTGALGDGVGGDSSVPVSVLALTGSTPLMGASDLALGAGHSCVRLVDGTVACWGSGEWGENGQSVGLVRPMIVSGLPGIGALGAGGSHSCAVTADGADTLCWGQNSAGQLGSGATSTEPGPIPVAVVDL